jgi:hypothetical protein
MDKNKQLKSVADAYRQMKLDEQQRLTPQREKVLDNADRQAQIALGQSLTFGKNDPAYIQRATDALDRHSRAQVLRHLAEPEGKRTGAYAGSTDKELKADLEHMRKLRTSPEHQQAVSNWAKKESQRRKNRE